MSELPQPVKVETAHLTVLADELEIFIKASEGVEKLHAYYRLATVWQRVNSTRTLEIIEQGLAYSEGLPRDEADEGAALLWLCKALCMFYRADYGAAEESLDNVQDLSRNNPASLAAIRMENLRGVMKIERGRYADALQHYDSALVKAQRVGSTADEFNSIVNIGNAYNRLEQYPKALEEYLRAVGLAERIGDSKLTARVLGNIASVYSQLGDGENHRKYSQQGLDLHIQNGDIIGQALILSNLGGMEILTKNFSSAYEYYTRAIALREQAGDIEHQTSSQREMCIVCMELKLYEEAFFHITKSLETANTAGAMFKYAQALVTYGHLLFETGKNTEALEALEQSISICAEYNYTLPVVEALRAKSVIEKAEGRWEEAVATIEKIVEATESVREKQILIQRETLQTIFDLDSTRALAESEQKKNYELAAKDAQLEARNSLLEHLNEEKNELLRIVAHDLKNPLSAINIITRMIKETPAMEQDELQELCGDILSSTQRMTILIHDLLNIEELERGNLSLNAELVDVNDVVLSVVRQADQYAASKNIRIEFEGDENTIISADEVRLVQVLENLLSNAVKFSSLNSSVRVSVSKNNSFCLTSIQDSGPGISDKDKEKLFTKFARLSAKPTGGEHSTGLGLAIVKRITDMMGGSIRVDSREGEGAEFIVSFPLATEGF